MDWNAYAAALFDLDGVITPTAEVHMRAWQRMFNSFLTSRGISEPYTDADYFAYVDGKPRYDGVRSFLDSRDIALDYGRPSDSRQAETICGLGNAKDYLFNTVLDEEGVTAYSGSYELIVQLRASDKPMAIVSSSRNAGHVLQAAGIREFFSVVVDGKAADSSELLGKPHPDMFLCAAHQLHVLPEHAAAFEDATSGVESASNAGFGLIIGVDRGAGADALKRAGAHRVVTDLAELM